MQNKKAILESGSDFYNIYLNNIGKKMIRVEGYYYDEGQDNSKGTSRYVEYSDFTMPLQEFLEEELYLDEARDFYQSNAKQFITDMTESAALLDMESDDVKELPFSKLTIDTPCGSYVDFESGTRPQNQSVSDNYTVWFAAKLRDKTQMSELTEHLSMNGYSFDTNGDDVIFIVEDEIDYVETIMAGRGIEYDRL